jgi:hypothetical protein
MSDLRDPYIFTLSFEGNEADQHKLDFYDVSQAMLGFQRSLAITTHLILNGEVIVRAPTLKGASIYAYPPKEGSWIVKAGIVLGGLYYLGTLPTDTPLGHIVFSAYDYVVSETLGFEVDYEKSLGKSYKEHKKMLEEKQLPILEQSYFDSVVEKCEPAIKDMHRPIVKSQTARSAKIHFSDKDEVDQKALNTFLNEETYEYISGKMQGEFVRINASVSSYNMNTYTGRIFVPEKKRTIPFILSDEIRDKKSIEMITTSLGRNALDTRDSSARLIFGAVEIVTVNNRLIKYIVKSICNQDR